MSAFSRRSLLRAATTAALAIPVGGLFPVARRAFAAPSGGARRVIFFYFPDGVAGPAADGSPSLWHLQGPERGFSLNEQLQGLGTFKDDCVFLNGLSSGPTDTGSHPGGAKKILTAVDGGNGESIDQYLARTAGSGTLFRHVYLGAEDILTNNKSTVLYPDFSSAVRTAMAEETQRLFSHVTLDGSGRFDELFTADYSFLNADLAKLYGVGGVSGSQLGKQPYGSIPRSGVLGHGSVLGLSLIHI